MNSYQKEISKRIKINNLSWKARIKIKKILLKHNIRNISFCKKCGIDVRDFLTTDKLWKEIEIHIEDGHTLCYNCFIDACVLNNIKFNLNEVDK